MGGMDEIRLWDIWDLWRTEAEQPKPKQERGNDCCQGCAEAEFQAINKIH
jgi:hypothetical protein